MADENRETVRFEGSSFGQFALFAGLPQERTQMVALYDVAPKFEFSAPESGEDRKKIIEREFTFAGGRYRITLKPTRLKMPDGTVEDRYLGEREQIVEDVVRRLATKHGRLTLRDQTKVRACFTVNEVREELARVKHSFRYREIAEALVLLNEVRIQIEFLDVRGSPILSAPAFPVLVMRRKGEEDGETYVEFNPLVSEAIRLLRFDEVDYETLMKIRDPVSRLLFKRLQAQVKASGSPYLNLSACEIRRDSGMLEWKNHRHLLRRVQQSVEALVASGVIEHLEVDTIRDGRQIVDLRFSVSVSADFMAKIHASKRASRDNELEFERLSRGRKPGGGFLLIEEPEICRIRVGRAQRASSTLELALD
jgi:hypothetical protein